MRISNKEMSKKDGARRFDIISSDHYVCTAYTYLNENKEWTLAVRSDLFPKTVLLTQKTILGDRDIIDIVAESLPSILRLDVDEWVSAREYMNLTRAQASEALGVSLGTLNHVECGSRCISAGLRVRMFRLMRNWSLCVAGNAPDGVSGVVRHSADRFNEGKNIVQRASVAR